MYGANVKINVSQEQSEQTDMNLKLTNWIVKYSYCRSILFDYVLHVFLRWTPVISQVSFQNEFHFSLNKFQGHNLFSPHRVHISSVFCFHAFAVKRNDPKTLAPPKPWKRFGKRFSFVLQRNVCAFLIKWNRIFCCQAPFCNQQFCQTRLKELFKQGLENHETLNWPKSILQSLYAKLTA